MRPRAFLVLLLLAGCGDTEDVAKMAPPWTSPSRHGHGETCADCHREQSEGWAKTGMARSLMPVSIEEVRDLGGRIHPETGYRYDFIAPEFGPGILETRPGDPSHQRAAPLVLAVGSGRQDRSYVLQEGSMLWFAPLEALTAADGRLAQLAPPHAMQPGLRFRAPITGECLGCHTDQAPPRDYPLNARPEGWAPEGISCAACHAGTGEHVAHREAEPGSPAASAADPIASLGDLSRNERMSICAACHLQGDARIVLEPGVLGPPGPDSGDLLEQRAIFVAREATSELGFVSQVERLVLSSCYTSTEMVCATCHDPHHTLADEAEQRRVRDACFRCHAQDGAPGLGCSREVAADDPDCASCHMPRRPVFDVEGLRIHDHWIRRRPGDPPATSALRAHESSTGDWRRFTWPDGEAPEHVDDPGLLMMALHSAGHGDLASQHVDEAVHPKVRSLPMYHHVRGILLEGLGRLEEARSAYEAALELDPEEAASAVNLGPLLARLGDTTQARHLLDGVIERYPRAEGALRNRAILSQQEGDLRGFLEDMRRSFELRPDSAVARAIAAGFEAIGDRSRVAEWSQRAEQLTPDAR